jgi:molybdopterin molybdotransferase
MISPDEARQLIIIHTGTLPVEQLLLQEAYGRILAKPVLAPHDHPFFDQSAMDGYALRREDLDKFETLLISDEIPAGKTDLPTLNKGEAFRIYTGAAVPRSADTVVIQEHTERIGNQLKVLKQPLLGANIRRQGEQIKKGHVALEAGHRLNAAGVGFLASIGVSNVSTSLLPKVTIVATGNEFLATGEELIPGKIFESNSVFLESALRQEEIIAQKTRCEDNSEKLQKLLSDLAQINDLTLITGGVSVGDYDFTPEALQLAGFEVIFHKINQKPGKPLLFAKRADGKLAFGLPGNPQSVLSCFYQYVIPALRKMQGALNLQLLSCRLPILETIKNISGKTLFVPAFISQEGVIALTNKGSHALLGSALANALIELPPEPEEIDAGTNVLIHLLP